MKLMSFASFNNKKEGVGLWIGIKIGDRKWPYPCTASKILFSLQSSLMSCNVAIMRIRNKLQLIWWTLILPFDKTVFSHGFHNELPDTDSVNLRSRLSHLVSEIDSMFAKTHVTFSANIICSKLKARKCVCMQAIVIYKLYIFLFYANYQHI